MTNFEYAFQVTVGLEGGYCVDNGGPTKYGISQNAYPQLDIANLTLQQAQGIYKRDYWDRLGLDQIPNKYVAAEIFDTAVNTGTARATFIAQAACNYLGKKISKDGNFGPQTVATLNLLAQKNTFALVMALNLFQGIWYATIEEANPTLFDTYSAGWMQRLRIPKEIM